jgi:hypothetical protein
MSDFTPVKVGTVGKDYRYNGSPPMRFNGLPYLCIMNSTDLKIEIWKGNAAGTSWTKVGGTGLTILNATGPMAALDSQGIVHILYYSSLTAISYCTFNLNIGYETFGTPEVIESGFITPSHFELSITIDANDKPHAIYCVNHARPTAPSLANGAAGNVTAGLHYVKVTFVTAQGETFPGASASLTADGAKQIDVTNVATGGAEVTQRNIYMTTAGGSTYYLVNASKPTINDNTTTTYTINVSDTTLVTQPAAPASDGCVDNLNYNNRIGDSWNTTPIVVEAASLCRFPSVVIDTTNSGDHRYNVVQIACIARLTASPWTYHPSAYLANANDATAFTKVNPASQLVALYPISLCIDENGRTNIAFHYPVAGHYNKAYYIEASSAWGTPGNWIVSGANITGDANGTASKMVVEGTTRWLFSTNGATGLRVHRSINYGSWTLLETVSPGVTGWPAARWQYANNPSYTPDGLDISWVEGTTWDYYYDKLITFVPPNGWWMVL